MKAIPFCLMRSFLYKALLLWLCTKTSISRSMADFHHHPYPSPYDPDGIGVIGLSRKGRGGYESSPLLVNAQLFVKGSAPP